MDEFPPKEIGDYMSYSVAKQAISEVGLRVQRF